MSPVTMDDVTSGFNIGKNISPTSTMVLYYLDESTPNRGVPDYLIDTNVRIDYGKLRHLLVVGRQLTPLRRQKRAWPSSKPG